MLFDGIFAGRRVFITGHTGFKGSWLTSWLQILGAEVTGYAMDPPTHPALFDALGLADRIRDIRADVRDADRLRAEMIAAAPSVVFHLAAQPIVRLAYTQPQETLATNIMGTVNLLEAVRAAKSVSAVVVITSDKCYANSDDERFFREDDPMGGNDPYSASKGCAELVVAAYRKSFFGQGKSVALASARAGNVIGGGDWATDRLVPDCVRALTLGHPVIVRNPEAIRPWQHALEPLTGYLLLASHLLSDGPLYAEAWNFGPIENDGTRSVRWMVEHFIEAWGQGTWVQPEEEKTELHEDHSINLDSSKARERLGWSPAWNAATAVCMTADWYRAYTLDPSRARSLVDQQIEDHTEAARAAGIAWAQDRATQPLDGIDQAADDRMADESRDPNPGIEKGPIR